MRSKWKDYVLFSYRPPQGRGQSRLRSATSRPMRTLSMGTTATNVRIPRAPWAACERTHLSPGRQGRGFPNVIRLWPAPRGNQGTNVPRSQTFTRGLPGPPH